MSLEEGFDHWILVCLPGWLRTNDGGEPEVPGREVKELSMEVPGSGAAVDGDSTTLFCLDEDEDIGRLEVERRRELERRRLIDDAQAAESEAPRAPAPEEEDDASMVEMMVGNKKKEISCRDSALRLNVDAGVTPVVPYNHTKVFEYFMAVVEMNPRRLKRIFNVYSVQRHVAHFERPDAKGGRVSRRTGWPVFSRKLIKWTLLCECFPYRMSLLVMFILDFEQKGTMNQVANEISERTKGQGKGKNDSVDEAFFKYYNTSGDGTGEETETHKLAGTETISSVFFNHVYRFVFVHKLAEKMNGLDGDPELFAILLTMLVPPDNSDITVDDVLGPPNKNARKGAFVFGDRINDLSLLEYSFNLNPALREQLMPEISALISESELKGTGTGHSEGPDWALKRGVIQDKRTYQQEQPSVSPAIAEMLSHLVRGGRVNEGRSESALGLASLDDGSETLSERRRRERGGGRGGREHERERVRASEREQGATSAKTRPAKTRPPTPAAPDAAGIICSVPSDVETGTEGGTTDDDLVGMAGFALCAAEEGRTG